MKIRKSISLTIISCLLVLSACSAQPSSPNSPSEKNDTGSQKNTTIRVGTWDTATGLEAFNQIVQEFNKTNPNFKVLIESSPDQYTTKILTQIAGGDAPDIITVPVDDLRRFYEVKATTDLTPYMEADKEIKPDIFMEDILNTGKFDGEYHYLPKDWSNMAVYYNKKMFDQAGVPYPKAGWTWDDFYAAAKKLTVKQGNKIIQWGAMTRGADSYMANVLINAWGGQLISPDGTKFDGYMNNDAVVKALEFYRNMYFGDTVLPSPTETNAFQGIDMFGSQRVAMWVSGRWFVTQYNKTPGLEYATAPLPVGPKGPSNTLFYAGFAISSTSKNKDAAWQFLKFLAGPVGSKIMTSNGFSAVKQVTKELGQSDDPIFKSWLDTAEFIKTGPGNINYHYQVSGAQEFKQVMDRVVLPDKVDIKEALNTAGNNAQKLLDKSMKNAK
jgi:multiple sugar transport system substrate-binding protein